jgi:hypothetical protein
MAIFLIALGIIGLAIAGLSLGVVLGRPPIKGSCGGLACIPGGTCSACPKQIQSGGAP